VRIKQGLWMGGGSLIPSLLGAIRKKIRKKGPTKQEWNSCQEFIQITLLLFGLKLMCTLGDPLCALKEFEFAQQFFDGGRVHMGPGKSWNFILAFSTTFQSWKVLEIY